MTELEKATVEAFKQLGSISYFEMFKAGAEWQKKQLIEKAYEWLKSYRQNTPDGTGYIARIVNDKTLEEFRKAMED